MIVASPKSVAQIKTVLDGHAKVLFAGCGTCVTVCLAGGEREVGIAAYAVRMARTLELMPERWNCTMLRSRYASAMSFWDEPQRRSPIRQSTSAAMIGLSRRRKESLARR